MMSEEVLKLLDLRRLPARLTSEQTAPLLGLSAHDIPILIGYKLLIPLGNPAGNAVKHFAATEIEKRAHDTDWLDKATKALYAYWAKKNQKRKSKAPAVGNVDAIVA
jgi:hypothetical protein